MSGWPFIAGLVLFTLLACLGDCFAPADDVEELLQKRRDQARRDARDT